MAQGRAAFAYRPHDLVAPFENLAGQVDLDDRSRRTIRAARGNGVALCWIGGAPRGRRGGRRGGGRGGSGGRGCEPRSITRTELRVFGVHRSTRGTPSHQLRTWLRPLA